MTTPNRNSDRCIVERQLREKPTLTYPTVYKHRIVEMTAAQRKRLLERIEQAEAMAKST